MRVDHFRSLEDLGEDYPPADRTYDKTPVPPTKKFTGAVVTSQTTNHQEEI